MSQSNNSAAKQQNPEHRAAAKKNGNPSEIQNRQTPGVAKVIKRPVKDKKLNKLMEYLHSIKDDNFTGYIKVNFSQGSIGRIEKFEEILRK